MVFVSIFSDSFLDCLPRGGRILPRRIPMDAASALPALPRSHLSDAIGASSGNIAVYLRTGGLVWMSN